MWELTQIENDLAKLEGSIQAAKKCKTEILQAIEAAKAGKQETVRGGVTVLCCPHTSCLGSDARHVHPLVLPRLAGLRRWRSCSS